MVPQYPEILKKKVDQLPSNRDLLKSAPLWVIVSASLALVIPELGIAMGTVYGLKKGLEIRELRKKRQQLRKEYTDSAIHYSVKLH